MSQSTKAPVPNNPEDTSSGDNHYPQYISVIENKGSGDVWQVMFSTGETLRGKNEGHGGRIRQLGGHGSDATVQQLSRDMLAFRLQNSDHEQPVRDEAAQLERLSDLRDRHGPGHYLRARLPQVEQHRQLGSISPQTWAGTICLTNFPC